MFCVNSYKFIAGNCLCSDKEQDLSRYVSVTLVTDKKHIEMGNCITQDKIHNAQIKKDVTLKWFSCEAKLTFLHMQQLPLFRQTIAYSFALTRTLWFVLALQTRIETHDIFQFIVFFLRQNKSLIFRGTMKGGKPFMK